MGSDRATNGNFLYTLNLPPSFAADVPAATP
jgi:hypothetical protein